MNSVDTRWVTDENPVHIKKNQREGLSPLDCIDGATRICDPFLASVYDKNKMPRYDFYSHAQQDHDVCIEGKLR